jgi:hypothetical protein
MNEANVAGIRIADAEMLEQYSCITMFIAGDLALDIVSEKKVVVCNTDAL